MSGGEIWRGRSLGELRDGAEVARTLAPAAGSPGSPACEGGRLQVVDRVATAFGLAGHPAVRAVPGVFLTGPLPSGPFDVDLPTSVTHICGPEQNRAVSGRVAAVLQAGGVPEIADRVRGEATRAPPMGVLMLLRAEAGDPCTAAEYRRWVEDAGLDGFRLEAVDPDRRLLSVIRPGAKAGPGAIGARHIARRGGRKRSRSAPPARSPQGTEGRRARWGGRLEGSDDPVGRGSTPGSRSRSDRPSHSAPG